LDNVDEEYLRKPRKWNPSSVSTFMLRIGPTSSVFDITTFLLMYFVICPRFVSDGVLFHNIAADATVASGMFEGLDMRMAYIGLFHAGWFVESMWSQTLVIHMLRTPKIPILQSRASFHLATITLLGMTALTVIPFTFVGRKIGLVPLPGVYFAWLALTIVLYMLLAQWMKHRYIKRYGELL